MQGCYPSFGCDTRASFSGPCSLSTYCHSDTWLPGIANHMHSLLFRAVTLLFFVSTRPSKQSFCIRGIKQCNLRSIRGARQSRRCDPRSPRWLSSASGTTLARRGRPRFSQSLSPHLHYRSTRRLRLSPWIPCWWPHAFAVGLYTPVPISSR